MSSFSENFERDENTDTQYDDSAVFSFAGSLLIVIILFLVYLIWKRIFYSKRFLHKFYKKCQCKVCKARLQKHYAKERGKSINLTLIFLIILTIFLSYLLYQCYFEILNKSSDFKKFDPYEILEVSHDADLKLIKKSYKKLALRYHPDKNLNNLQAKAKFILIAKAYETLTSESARKNFEQYGNPDGPGTMRLAVGLPSFVLNKENHMPILVLFLIVIWIVIPAWLIAWWRKSSKYDEYGNLLSANDIFEQYLKEDTQQKHLPFIIGNAQNYSTLRVSNEEREEIKVLYEKFKDQMPAHQEETIPIPNKKAICILYSYYNGIDLKIKTMQEDMERVLVPVGGLIEHLYMYVNNDIAADDMNLGWNCMKNLILFSQSFFQKINEQTVSVPQLSPFLQLPHFNDDKLRLLDNVITSNNMFTSKEKAFYEYIRKTPEERKELLLKLSFEQTQIEDIETVTLSFPVYETQSHQCVEGFDDFLLGDKCKYKVIIERKNLLEREKMGISHSNHFPGLFRELIFVAFIKGDDYAFSSLEIMEQKFMAFTNYSILTEVGKETFTVEILSLSYKGLDMAIPVEVEVKESSEKREAFLKSIDKRKVEKLEPSYFQKLLESALTEDFAKAFDEGESEDEEGDDKKKTKEEDEEDEEDDTTDKGKDQFSEETNKKSHTKKKSPPAIEIEEPIKESSTE